MPSTVSKIFIFLMIITSKVVSTILSTELRYLVHNICVCWRMEKILAWDTEWSISGTWYVKYKCMLVYNVSFNNIVCLNKFWSGGPRYNTCNNSLSSACITAWDQSITSANGRRQPFESKTGTHPARSVSMKRKEPSLLPRGTKQNVEFCKSES